MRILDSAWFAAAALAIPILAMYMLKLRRKEIEISSIFLWSVVLRDRQANTPWQKLKRNILLLLQLLILAGLVFSLVRPALLTSSIASGSVVVILDGSASMRAFDEKTAGNSVTRFEAAQAAVRALINELQNDARMTIILAANPPVILVNGENDARRLRQVLDDAQPGEGSADWFTTFAVAAGALRQISQTDDRKENNTIVILSDGGMPSSGLPSLPGEVRFIPLGQTSTNIALGALAIRPVSDEESVQELYARVTNYGDEDHEVVVSFYGQATLGEQPLLFHARQITIPAQGSIEIALRDLPAELAIVTARLSATETEAESLDAFALDDTAFAISPKRNIQRIFMLSQDFLESGVDNQFILRMLFAFGHNPYRPTLQGEEGARIAQLPSDAFDLYILDGAMPVNASEQPVLPVNGNLLLINPPPNAMITSSGIFTPTGQTEIEINPLTNYVDWREVYISQAQDIVRPSWALPLVTDSGLDKPLVFAGETGGRRVAVITFDLHASDLPLHLSYPILMSNLLNFLLPTQAVQVPLEGIAPNTTVSILTRTDIEQVVVGLPNGSFRNFYPTGQTIEFSDTNLLGLYTVNIYLPGEDNPNVEAFAVNLFDVGESNITPKRAIQVGQTRMDAAEASAIGEVELWPWFVLITLVLGMIEWWVYHRPSWSRGEKALAWFQKSTKFLKGIQR
jgi:hypothetical protein